VLCCTAPASRVGEHAIPDWFRKDQAVDGPYTTYDDGRPFPKRDGSPRRRQAYEAVTLPVCDAETGNDCNGILARRFENPARPVIRDLVYQSLPLSPSETAAFSLWALKTTLLLAHPQARFAASELQPQAWDLGAVSDDLYGWMITGQAPPDSLSLWLTRPGRQAVRTASESLIPLPIVVINGKTTRFRSFEFDHRFDRAGMLRLTLVHHPGWPIENPLEEGGRAFRLWPLPPGARLDIASIPRIRWAELGWLGGFRLVFREDVELTKLPPLSPATAFMTLPGVMAVEFPGADTIKSVETAA